MRQELPEERLLNLIKGKGRKKPEEKQPAPPAAGVSLGITQATSRIFQKVLSAKGEFLLKVNRVLAFLLIPAVLYAGYVFFFSTGYVSRGPLEFRGKKSIAKAERQVPVYFSRPRLGDYGSYAAVIGSRELFKDGNNAPPPAVVQAASLLSRFSLVGILPGDQPQAIIEDKGAGKTYYLLSGAAFDDGAVVQEIGNGRVILEYHGETINLVL